jgi:hypothetical protein
MYNCVAFVEKTQVTLFQRGLTKFGQWLQSISSIPVFGVRTVKGSIQLNYSLGVILVNGKGYVCVLFQLTSDFCHNSQINLT